MIVMFQGTNDSNNCVAQTFSLCGAVSALKYNRKTLLLQLTDSKSIDAEQLLIGKFINETTVNNSNHLEVCRIEESGIDALMRRALTAKLGKDHFASSCRTLIEKSPYLLDIATITKKEDFIATLESKEINIILKYAKEIYDNIFVLLDGKNTSIMQEILQLADSYITCLHQSPKKETWNIKEGAKEVKVIPKYDSSSAFSCNFLKKLYKVKSLYAIPYNTAYRDAYMSGTLLDFMISNINDSKEDDNYPFVRSIESIMEAVAGKEIIEEYTEPDKLSERKKKNALLEVESFTVESKTKHTGIFRKRKVDTYLLEQRAQKETEDMEKDIEEYLDEDEEDTNIEPEIVEESLEEDLDKNLEEISEETVEEDDEFVPLSQMPQEEKSDLTEELEEEDAKEELFNDKYITIPATSNTLVADVRVLSKDLIDTLVSLQGDSEKNENWLRGAYLLLSSLMLTVKVDENKSEEQRTLKEVVTLLTSNSVAELETQFQYVSFDQSHPAHKLWAAFTGARAVAKESIKEGLSKIFLSNKSFLYQEKPVMEYEIAEDVKEKEMEKPASKENWICEKCGTENHGAFCMECGEKKKEEVEKKAEEWICPECGTTNKGKFCEDCGTKKPEEDWTCPECGTTNKKKFCSNCGHKH